MAASLPGTSLQAELQTSRLDLMLRMARVSTAQSSAATIGLIATAAIAAVLKSNF
jgi:hypothetical protein